MKHAHQFEWEAIAGLIAAVTAIVLHFLNITDVNVLRVLTLVLVALLFIRDIRREPHWSLLEGGTRRSIRLLEEVKAAMHPAELDLIGPTRLRQATADFAKRAHGEVVWFNACPHMFAHNESCQAILGPFFTNPGVTSVRFVLDIAQQEQWHALVDSAIAACATCHPVPPPIWTRLDSGVSFLIAETDLVDGSAEALVSFWGEPFMASHQNHRMPGYIIHVRSHSELISRLREVERACRMS